MTIDSAGNLGIGMSDPDYKLEVSGTVHLGAEQSSPSAPSAGDGGLLYVKPDGNLYWVSDDVAETSLSDGAGISFNGSTANGLVTYGGATQADVEANLTFDGSTLSVTGDTSGSGNLTAHKFYTGQGNTTISKLGVISSSADATLSSASFGTAFAAGQLHLGGNLLAAGTSTFGGAVNTYNTVTMTQDLNAASSSFTNMYGSGHLQMAGNILGSTVKANGGDISGSGNFLVAGGITGGNSGWSIDGSGDATVNTVSASSTLEVVGAAYLGSTLAVTGNVSAVGNLSSSARLYAHQADFAQGGVSISEFGDLTVGGASISAAGDGTFASLNASNGGINNTGPLANVTTISGSSTLEMVGNAYLGGTLNVTGAVTLDGVASGSTAGPGSFLATTAAGLVVLDEVPYAPGSVDGLRLTFYTVETVTIGTGDCRDAANSANIPSTGSLNVSITGSGANGLDTGAEASSTWYAVFIISGSSGVAGLMSTSPTAPTMPSGYDKKRRVGWVYNHSDDDLQNFWMEGSGRDRIVWWNEAAGDYPKVLDAGVSNGSWTTIDVSTRVPTTADSMWVRGYNSAGGTTSARVRPADYLAGTAGTSPTYMLLMEDEARWLVQQFFCVDTKSIKYYSDSATPRTTLAINGWKETI